MKEKKKKHNSSEKYLVLVFASGAASYLLYHLMVLSGYLLSKTHKGIWNGFIQWTSSSNMLNHCTLIILLISIISLIICKLFVKKIKLTIFMALAVLAGPILVLIMNNAIQR